MFPPVSVGRLTGAESFVRARPGWAFATFLALALVVGPNPGGGIAKGDLSLYVASDTTNNTGEITLLNQSGSNPVTSNVIVNGLTGLGNITADSSGNVYVVTSDRIGEGGLYITEYNSSGGLVRSGTFGSETATAGNSIYSVAGLAFNNGSLYAVIDYSQGGSGAVYQINSTLTTATLYAGSISTTLNQIAFDNSGNLYASSNLSGRIYEFGPGGGTTPTVISPNPSTGNGTNYSNIFNGALTVGANGDVYTRNYFGNLIQLDQATLTPTTIAGIPDVGALAYDPSGGGDLYGTTGSSIVTISPASGSSMTFASGFDNAESLAFIPSVTAVPEPSSLIMLGMGSLGVSILARYFRRTKGKRV